MRAARPVLAERAGANLERALCAHVPAIASSNGIWPPATIAGYWSVGSEAHTRGLLGILESLGFGVSLPVVVAPGEPLVFRHWQVGDILDPGPHATFQPAATAALADPGLLLVPLLAFDRRGGRLGQGGGYYDRTLRTLRARRRIVAIGIAFAGQEVEEVPASPHDERLDGFVTEEGVIRCGGEGT